MEYSCQPYNEGQFSLTATNPKAWSRPGGAARHELAAWADKQNSHKLFNAWISCCVEVGVVIKLDGAQHLADAEAYRRDRRKDALLQQNGYFVLRFLAEDVGKNLDLILDTVLTALVHREKNRKC